MESLIVVVLLAVLVFPVWVIVRIISLGRQNNALAEALRDLRAEITVLRSETRASRTAASAPVTADAARSTAFTPAASPTPPPTSAAPTAPVPARPEPPAAASPLPPVPVPVVAPPPVQTPPERPQPPPAAPPPLPRPVAATPPPPPPPPPRVSPTFPTIDWEQFMGAKLFAWLGGLAAFLAAAFFVKYSFEHDLIPPEVRVSIGFLFAIGLVIGGVKLARTRYTTTSQTLIATGIVSLYGVTFACNSVYHFSFFGPIATFALMALITACAFLLAVRLEGRVIAVLGILGGFLTPILLSTGQDNPVGLYGYLTLLNAGLIAVALHRRWHFLVPLGAGGTILMQVGWAARFLSSAKAETAVWAALLFCGVFLGAYFLARRQERALEADDESPFVPREYAWSAAVAPAYALALSFAFLAYPGIAARPGLVLSFVLLADISLLILAWFDEPWSKLHGLAGAAVFAFLGTWTGSALTAPLLPWVLGFVLAFAMLHTTFPLLLQRFRDADAPTLATQLFAPLALLLLMIPILRLEPLSFAIWPCVLLLDVIAVGAALLTGSLFAVACVLILTLAATGAWVLKMPASSGLDPTLLFVIGVFALFFFGVLLWLGRRLPGLGGRTDGLNGLLGSPRAQLPAMSALLPFILLVMITQKLALPNPSAVFGLALLLVVLTLGLAAVMALEWLPACALAGVAALEYAWHGSHFQTARAGVALGWYVLFYAAFTVYPFLFRRAFARTVGPWAISALSGVVHFFLIHRTVQQGWPNEVPGLLPAAFAVPALAGLALLARGGDITHRPRLTQVAWFGGVALLFITLIFPLQFERQWLTLAWALEGVALLWLFHRVPHPGLRGTGVVLLVTAFARLAVNPAVLEYHTRSEFPLLNWYLYSYGITALALFAGARLVAPPRHEVMGVNAPPLLNALGTILAFLLLNIEIADYFSYPGASVLTFEFSGNFARDMTYTIAWALFALVLLLVSLWRGLKAGRYAALALLSAALLKLFLHDLSRLHSLYRIGALLAVAAIAIAASFAYQRFLPADDKTPPPQP